MGIEKMIGSDFLAGLDDDFSLGHVSFIIIIIVVVVITGQHEADCSNFSSCWIGHRTTNNQCVVVSCLKRSDRKTCERLASDVRPSFSFSFSLILFQLFSFGSPLSFVYLVLTTTSSLFIRLFSRQPTRSLHPVKVVVVR